TCYLSLQERDRPKPGSRLWPDCRGRGRDRPEPGDPQWKGRNRERALQRDQRHAAKRVPQRTQGVCRRAGQGEEIRGRTRRSPGDGEGASRANRKSERAGSDQQTCPASGCEQTVSPRLTANQGVTPKAFGVFPC